MPFTMFRLMSNKPSLWYVYPMWHTVSFTLIARKHIEYMKKYVHIEEVDELAFPHITPHSKPVVFIHPFYYCMIRASKFISRKLHMYTALIGIDVADSDHISNLAVSITNYAKAIVVPSSYAKRVYEKSGVRVPVYVVPHGLDVEWYHKPKTIKYFHDLHKLKQEKKLHLLLYYLWHSPYRKGFDLVYEFYKRLKKERKDVMLVFKTRTSDGKEAKLMRQLGVIHIYGWLTEEQKIELYDLCDIYPLFSRGGGFEHNGLEALVRGEVVLAAKEGSWTEYLPSFSLVDCKPCPYVLKDNPIHDGRGVEVIVEKAVDKAHEILDNLEEYKAKVREHVEKHVRPRFNWPFIASRLYNIYNSIVNELAR